jgi:RNase H-like domain found in reverse transcriptase
MTFFLISIALVERNYIIYNKELLAIIRYFKEWSPELRLLEEDPILIFIDYKTLEYFILIKKLIY